MNFNIFGGFQKNEYFLGYEDFVYIFFFFFLGGGGHHKIGLHLGIFSMHFFGYFLKVKVQNGGIFGVAKISNIYLGCLKFLIFFCEL